MRAPGTVSGGKALVHVLEALGTKRVFCVPGESYLPVLDALYERRSGMALITCRHEGAAALMAEATGRLTGRPGVCLVTRGPGATHAAVGIHVAAQDSAPLVLLVGQVARGHLGRDAFQEMDVASVFRPLAKECERVMEAARLPEALARAFRVAVSGRPGPVVLEVPEDVFAETIQDPVSLAPLEPAETPPGFEAMSRLKLMLDAAHRPLVILGGSGWAPEARSLLRSILEANRLPAVTAFRRQDLLDNRSPAYVGHLGLGLDPMLAERVLDADLVLAIGTRLGDIATGGYRLLGSQTLIHVYPAEEELGRVWRPDLAIRSTPANFVRALEGLTLGSVMHWRDWSMRARAAFEAFSAPVVAEARVDPARVMTELRDRLPDNAVLTNGAGNYALWAQRFFEYREFQTQLAPIAGAMGYGLPAALAAQLERPERTVVALAGDGCFQMTGTELATAVQYDLPVTMIVFDNRMLGTIRMHQERHFPGRTAGTDLANPDFAALARAYGAEAFTVEETAGFGPALDAALAGRRPALIHLKTDPEALAPGVTLTATRDAASAAGSGRNAP